MIATPGSRRNRLRSWKPLRSLFARIMKMESLRLARRLERPAFAVGTLDVLIGLRDIGDLEVRRIPEELGLRQPLAEADAQGHVAEEDRLGQWPGPAEVRSRGRATLRGVDPLDVVAGGPGKRLLRLLV